MEKSVQRVVWSEGMLMSPQHFQQQDIYHDRMLNERLSMAVPCAWGVSVVEFDVRSLEAGQVALSAFSGVLPKGTLLRFEAGDAEVPPARSLEDHKSPQLECIEVYLAIPAERVGTIAYARSASERGRSRYLVETRSVLDAVSAGSEEDLEFARKNVCLLFGDESRDDYESIKVAEIIRDDAGKFCFDPTYIAPCLKLTGAPSVVEGIRRLLAVCTLRRRSVSRELTHRDSNSVEFCADDVTRYLALHALNGVIPLLNHLLECCDVSAYQAYVILLQFAGQLATFCVNHDPVLFSNYNHIDLRNTFHPLFQTIIELVQVVVASRVITVRLEGRVDGMHLGRFQMSELAKPGMRVFLGIQTEVPEQAVYELMPRVAKIASWTEVSRYLSAAVSAVTLTACTRPPREVPLRSGKQYFSIATDAPAWRGILGEGTVAVHLPPPFVPGSTIVEIFAIPPA